MPVLPSGFSLKDVLVRLFGESGLAITDRAVDDLCIYLCELDNWNKRMNLTGIAGLEEMAVKHVGDTILLALHAPDRIGYMLDIGTGAGVPGLIFKIIRRDLNVVLVDSVRKKVSFLRYLIARLGLCGVWVEQGRVGLDDVPACRPEAGFDLIVSQAVGPIDELAGMAGGLLSKDGVIISLKGVRGVEEAADFKERLLEMGWEARPVKAYTPVGRQMRYLIFMKRVISCKNDP